MKPIPKKTLLAFASAFALAFPAMAADGTTAPADNTDKNERDRSGQTLTSGDQSEKPEDLKVTQAIRQAVVKDEGLSMTAKNVKIITADGQVTLRGPVNTADEKMKIDTLAKASAGSNTVDNQLEVTATN